MIFKNKNILVTGGTGSFGYSFISKIIKYPVNKIVVLSRDEKKQEDLRNSFNNSKLQTVIGDVRELNSLNSYFKDIDFIFHAAALKQVPSCEFYPDQAYKTNVVGTENVINASIENNVKKVIFLSTDKAVYPINAMGITKALMEKLVIARSRFSKRTKFCITRYGNVIGSRGSVIPLFINQIKNNQTLTITNKNMTRFIMSLDDATNLVIHALQKGNNGDILVQKSDSAKIEDIAKALMLIMNKPNHPIKIIGNRHGEKLYESLISHEESLRTKENKNFYKVYDDSRSLNYSSFIDKGNSNFKDTFEYSSNNTNILNVKELVGIFKKIKNLDL